MTVTRIEAIVSADQSFVGFELAYGELGEGIDVELKMTSVAVEVADMMNCGFGMQKFYVR